MKLEMVESGQRVWLLRVNAGRRLQGHLAGMGLIPGVELEVICKINQKGPVIVSVNGTRLSLGRKMAGILEVCDRYGDMADRAGRKRCGKRCHMNRRTIGLREMQVNQRGKISQVRADGELGRRIRDMGLVPDTDITIVGRAPLKDPVALRLRDFTLSLRNSEADYITVEVESGA